MKLIRTGGLLTRVIAPAATVTVTLVMSTSGAMAQPGGAADWASPGQWPMAGQNIDDTHFQAAEHQISPASVGRLAPRWTLTTAGAISATPTVDDGAVYVPDYGGKLWAVAAGSGGCSGHGTSPAIPGWRATSPGPARPSTATS